MFVRFYTHAVVGGLVQWAQEGMKMDNTTFLDEYAPILRKQLVFTSENYIDYRSDDH